MKHLKKMLPILAFVLSITVAFATKSMPKADDLAPVTGYAKNDLGQPCSQPVDCSTIEGEICRVSYPTGEIAHDRPNTVCLQPLFRPISQ